MTMGQSQKIVQVLRPAHRACPQLRRAAASMQARGAQGKGGQRARCRSGDAATIRQLAAPGGALRFLPTAEPLQVVQYNQEHPEQAVKVVEGPVPEPGQASGQGAGTACSHLLAQACSRSPLPGNITGTQPRCCYPLPAGPSAGAHPAKASQPCRPVQRAG